MMKIRLGLILLGFCTMASLAAMTQPEIIASAKLAELTNYPDADTVLVYDRENAVYQADGTAVESDELYQKVLTESGKRDLRELSFQFNATYSKLSVKLLEIIRKDGRIDPVDVAQNSKLSIDSSQMSANIYDPADKVLTVTLPDLEIGDMIHVISVREVIKPRMPNEWSNIYVLQGQLPVLYYEVAISAPKALPLAATVIKDPVKDTVTFTQSEADGRVEYLWVAKNVPQIIPEPEMPPIYMCCQRLLVSTIPDWQKISKWYYQLCRPHLDKVTLEMRAKVAELTQNCATPQDKIMKLFQFVSQQIRYMGITAESESPGYEPHDVSLTFNNRYGVCRDKAALLVAMLELANIKAYPVIFNSGYPKDEEAANMYFNHAIVGAEVTPGEYMLMDPTYETTRELFPASLSNMSYLAARPDGDTLRRSPVIGVEQNMLNITTASQVNSDNELVGRTQIEFAGVNDQMYRDAFSRWPADYRRQFFAGRLKRSLPGAELLELKFSPADVRNMKEPLKVEFTFSVKNYLADGAGEYLLPLPTFGTGLGAVNYVLNSVGLKKRNFMLRPFSTCAVREKYSIRLPDYCKIKSLPAKTELGYENQLKFSRVFTVNAPLLVGESYFGVNTVEIKPDAYLKLKEMLSRIDADAKELPIAANDYSKVAGSEVAAAFPGADSLVFQSEKRVEMLGRDRWLVEDNLRRKILTYAGVKNYSEVKITYNPAWEKVTVSGHVISPDGKINSLTDKEINLMDSPASAAAPRYPGEKILVVNLPGVEVNSTIVLSIRREIWSRQLFALYFSAVDADPVMKMVLELKAPRNADLKIAPTPFEFTLDKKSDGKFDTWVWTAQNLEARPKEPGYAGDYLYAPTVFVSSGSYLELAKKLGEALKARSVNQPQAAAKAVELCKDLKTDDEKVIAIRDFIAKSIRPVGIELNDLPLEALTPADKTLADGYGNSADRAILYAAMLNAVNLEGEFVPVAADAFIPLAVGKFERYPLNMFTGVLYKVSTRYLNDTNQYAKLGTVASVDRIALDINNGKLFAIKAAGPMQSATLVHYDITVKSDRSASIKIVESFRGIEYQSFKQKFSEMLPEEKSRYFEELLFALDKNAVMTGEPVVRLDEYPGRLEYTFDIPGFAVGGKEYLQFKLPGFDGFAANVRTAATARKTPFLRSGFSLDELEYRINIPAGYEVVKTMPAVRESGAFGTAAFYQYFNIGENMLAIDYGLTLPVEVVSQDNYLKLVNLQRELTKLSGSSIILKQVKK